MRRKPFHHRPATGQPQRGATLVIGLIMLALITLIAVAGLQWMDSMRPDYDVLIRNAHVLDGSGNPWFAADIAISADRVVAIGALPGAKAPRVIDAQGLTVAPGFIDVHSHAAEGLAGALNTATPLLAQGVTLEDVR